MSDLTGWRNVYDLPRGAYLDERAWRKTFGFVGEYSHSSGSESTLDSNSSASLFTSPAL